MRRVLSFLIAFAAVASACSSTPSAPQSRETAALRTNPYFPGSYTGAVFPGNYLGPNATGLTQDGLVVFEGDSNDVGLGSTDHMDNGLGIQSAYAGATERHYYATSITDPMVWVDVARRDLQPYDGTPGNASVGPQLSFGRYARQYGGFSSTVAISTFAAYGAKADHFKPTSTSPSNPKNLEGQLFDFIDSEQTSTGKQLGVLIWALGTNDAGDNTATANFAANLAAEDADLRARYGNRYLFVIVKINSNMTGAGTLANRNTIRAAVDAFVAAHPTNSIAITPDRIPVSNSAIHYVADEQISLGNMIAEAVSEKLRPGRNWNYNGATLTAPIVQSNNEPTARSSTSTGDLTVRGPAREQVGDWDFLIVGQGQSAVAPALTSAAGFTAVSGAQGVSTASGNNQYLYLYERQVAQAGLNANDGTRLADPIITDNNTTKQALIFSVRGAYQPGAYSSAVEAVRLTPSNASTTSVSATGTTTLGANRLVLHLETGFSSSANAGSSWADATLAGFALLRDSTDDTNETSAIASGTLAAAGATGTVTGTRAAATLMEDIVLSIKPALAGGETELTAALTDGTDPITGGQNETYTVAVTNATSTAASSVSVAVTLDASLTYVSASGTGWSCGRVGQVVTCTAASLAAGAAPSISVVATTATSASTITTTAAITSSNASTVNLSQSTTVQVTASKDATSNIYVPVSTTEWSNLSVHGVPSFQWGCQDASGSLVADFGGLNLPIGGSGQLYQQTVTGWTRKGVGTPDNGTTDWVSSNASLPDAGTTSVAVQAYYVPPASNPAGNRRIFAYGTTTTFGARVSTAGKLIFDVGTNNTTGTVTWTGTPSMVLRILFDRTNSRAILYATSLDGTKNEKLSVTLPGTLPTGKQIVVGGAGAAAAGTYFFVDILSGAAAEQSDANTKADWQALGWTVGWS